ncbi:MAG: FkbM family methyltransferase [Planctomycetaceae bacterium]
MKYRLPDGRSVHCLSRTDAALVFEEIFACDVYRRHGITIRAGDCILDVGANIGAFPLFVESLGLPATVYSLEPVPAIFEVLRRNATLCPTLRLHLRAIGLGARAGETAFTFYPSLPSNSTCHAEAASRDEAWTLAYIEQRFRDHPNRLLRSLLGALPRSLRGAVAAGVYRHYYRGERVVCRVCTLSGFIRDERLEHVDLLKLDVERSELDILTGLEEADWPKIRQAVVEVHDDSDVAPVAERFERHGFRVTVERHACYDNRTMLYATSGRQR